MPTPPPTRTLALAALGMALLLAAPPARAEDEPEPPIVELPPIQVGAPALLEPLQSLSPGEVARVLDAWIPASAVSGVRLTRRLAPSIGEVLALEPGVAATSFAPGASRPVIRGLDGDRIRTLENGAGSLDVASASPDHAVATEPLLARRVEVVRGPAALRFGTTAIGGVVNVLDGRIPDPTVASGLRARSRLLASSADSGRAGALEVEGRRGAWGWHAAGFQRRAEDYRIPGHAWSTARRAEVGANGPRGRVPSTFAEGEGATIGVTRFFAGGWAGVALGGVEQRYGVPSLEEEPIHIELSSRRLDARGAWECLGGCWERLDVTAAFVDYEHVEFEADEAGTTFRSQAFEGRVEATHASLGGWRGTLGVHGAWTDFEALGEEAFVPPSTSGWLALLVLEQRALRPDLDLVLGARLQFDQVDGPRTRSFATASASVGLVHRLRPRTTLAGTLSYTERAPTATELFADGPHVATQQFEVGDDGLDPERSVAVDLALRHLGPRVSGEVTVFGQRVDDYVGLIPTGGVSDDLPEYRFEALDALFYGAEARAALHLLARPHLALDLDLLADWVRGRGPSGAGDLPRMPAPRLGVGASARFGRGSARVLLVRALDQDRVADFERPTDGHTLLEAGLGGDLSLHRVRVSVDLRATNLLDEEARPHTSPLKELVPLPGRSFTLSLTLE